MATFNMNNLICNLRASLSNVMNYHDSLFTDDERIVVKINRQGHLSIGEISILFQAGKDGVEIMYDYEGKKYLTYPSEIPETLFELNEILMLEVTREKNYIASLDKTSIT